MLSLQNIYVFLIQSFLKSSTIRTDIGMKTISVTETQPQVMKLQIVNRNWATTNCEDIVGQSEHLHIQLSLGGWI